MGAFWASLFFVTAAEMGDKTQLVSLCFAARYRARVVLLGVFLATLLVHLFSVFIGEMLGLSLPTFWINIGAAFAFLGFGLWTLRGDTYECPEPCGRFAKFGPLFVVAGTFFLAELGDKTMLATVTIASREMEFIGVWLGSTFGMVVADAIAILVGVIFSQRLPERAIKIGSAAIFIGFGGLMMYQALVPGLS